MLPKLNRRRALFVLSKIDEILAWEQRVEHDRDTRFVELGRYLCEVRAGQYWRLANLKSFDDFLERRFPESRRKAYYLMSIHEHLPKTVRHELKQVGWAKAAELVKVARSDGQRFESAGLMLGSDKSRGYCLEMICADFLAGANAEDESPRALLLSILRLARLLPATEREELIEEVRGAG